MKNNIMHGGTRFLRTGILPKGKKHIGRLVDGIIVEMIDDLGGEAEISASQKIIISTIRQNLVFLGLVNEWIIKQPSIIDGKGEMLSPLNGFYLACQNTVTRNCRELGLKRVSPVQSLEGYLEAKAKESHSKRTPDTPDAQAGAGEIAPLWASCEGIES
jgi:hypothetical protein